MNRRKCIQVIIGFAFGATTAQAGDSRKLNLKRADLSAQRAFKPYYKMGGVLYFTVFEEASGDGAFARAAIRDTLLQAGEVHEGALNALVPRQISEAQFFGDWYDPSDGSLVWNGDVTTSNGQQLVRPKFTVLSDVKIVSSGAGIPEVGEGGQFAYAFVNPPYGLSGQKDKVQQVFDGIRLALLPLGHVCQITDWISSDLDKVSPYFKEGKEWWGMFLFTIYDATTRRLTVIIGSATD